MKPILFNTEMVKAIMDGRKTQTRRIIKPAPLGLTYDDGSPARKPPYYAGDILWVRETWTALPISPGGHIRIPDKYYYKAGPEMHPEGWRGNWSPSIHMPKDAARLFLRVISIRMQRLQDITPMDVKAEGVHITEHDEFDVEASEEAMERFEFEVIWDSTIRKSDASLYSWDANPWVWVIEFERIDRKDAIE